MNIVHNRYFDVVIHNNKSFCIMESASKPQKHGSALETLKKIEKIVNANLQYASSGDIYSTLHIEEIYQVLQGRATEISAGYRKKVGILKWFWKILPWITDKEKEFIAVDTAQTKIATRISRAPMLPLLPEEIIRHIGSYLPISDLITWRSVNRHGIRCSHLAILNRGREFGQKGNAMSKTSEYIQRFFSLFWDMHESNDLSSFFNLENKNTYFPKYFEHVANNLKYIVDISTEV